MSRVFNDISLGVSGVEEGPLKVLKVGVVVDEKQYDAEVGQKEVYTLSNFNSFNNLKTPSAP